MKTEVATDKASSPTGVYSQGLQVDGWVYVSGQGPLHPESTMVVGTTFAEQARQTFDNVKAIVEAAGCGIDDVVKVNVYLQNMDDFKTMDKIYSAYFRNEPFPCRTTVGAELKGILIEVDAVAFKSQA